MFLAGVGAFGLSTSVPTRTAGAAADHTDGPLPSPFAYVSPPPAAQVTVHRSGPTPPTAALVDVSSLAADGIPSTALDAYQRAASSERRDDPQCGLTWPLLAGIGRVESDHGRAAGAVLHTDGSTTPTIIGIALDGHGTARVPDTDKGRLDGDRVFDHAVGPMQFIPSTWALYGIDGNADGRVDPNNIYDAARTAAGYLCAAGGNLTALAGQTQAVLTYNDSDAYLTLVLKLESIYAEQVPGLVVPTLPAVPIHGRGRTGVPPADPGTALGGTSSPAPTSTAPPVSVIPTGTTSDNVTSPAPSLTTPITSAMDTPSCTASATPSATDTAPTASPSAAPCHS
jgi:membrane-bound lytic murein transglycosylase B